MTKGLKGFQKGHPIYFRHNDVSKEKLRQSRLGKHLSEETKLKVGANNWLKGKSMPESVKQKISVTLKGRPKSLSFKQKISKIHKGKIISLTQRARQSKIMTGRVSGMKDKKHTEASKQLMRNATIKNLINGKYKQTNTNIEIIMKNKLKKCGINYIHQYNFKNKFVCDFAIIKDKIIIECDGDYWHNRTDVKNRDKSKNAYIFKCGWVLLRFWEHDIINNIDKCINIINDNIIKSY